MVTKHQCTFGFRPKLFGWQLKITESGHEQAMAVATDYNHDSHIWA